jgi:hypothetical protein
VSSHDPILQINHKDNQMPSQMPRFPCIVVTHVQSATKLAHYLHPAQARWAYCAHVLYVQLLFSGVDALLTYVSGRATARPTRTPEMTADIQLDRQPDKERPCHPRQAHILSQCAGHTYPHQFSQPYQAACMPAWLPGCWLDVPRTQFNTQKRHNSNLM